MGGLAARLGAVAAATVAWSIVAVILVDVSGVLAPAPVATGAVPDADDDPCSLRAALATGTDARCAFAVDRAGTPPLTVDLDQRWSGGVLVQWLNVREPGTQEPARFVYAQTGGVSQPTRILRLGTIRAADGEEHVAYLVGRCGGTTCPSADLVVAGGRPWRTLLSVRLGRLADWQLGRGAVTTLEGWFPEGAQRAEGLVARRFAWDGTAYALRDTSMRPGPSPSPSPGR